MVGKVAANKLIKHTKNCTMKNLSAKQIEQIKSISPFTSTNFHGNTKKIGSLSISDFKAIVAKKYNRRMGNYVSKNGVLIHSFVFKKQPETNIQLLRRLINWSLKCKGTNYFKVLIEGNTGIYYAHPFYGHNDYNKSRVFDKNPQTLKLMHLFNSIIKNKTN